MQNRCQVDETGGEGYLLGPDFLLCKCMMNGMKGFAKQEGEGLKWANKAAEQNYPPALFLLAENTTVLG